MPPKKSSWPVRLSTKDKRKASDNATNASKSKNPRTSNTPLTRTIHQRVPTQPTVVAGASPRESPSASTAHPQGVQHAGSHTPAPGYGLPPSAMPPAQWWGPWGPPPQWAQYYQQWPALPAPAAPPLQFSNTPQAAGQRNDQGTQQQGNNVAAHLPLVATYTHTANQPNQVVPEVQQQDTDQLGNALTVSTVPGNQHEPILSLHVSQSFKK